MTAEKTAVKLAFSIDSTKLHVVDYDVTMAYEFFLGRHPEDSGAIQSHKQFNFDDMLKKFVQSDEFMNFTYSDLIKGSNISRLDNTRSPSRQQLRWIINRMVLDDKQREELYSVKSWNDFFNKFFVFGESDVSPLLEANADSVNPLHTSPDKPILNPTEENKSSLLKSSDIMLKLNKIEGILNEIKGMLKFR